MVYYKIKLTKIHFRKVTFLTLTRIFSSFSPSVGGGRELALDISGSATVPSMRWQSMGSKEKRQEVYTTSSSFPRLFKFSKRSKNPNAMLGVVQKLR